MSEQDTPETETPITEINNAVRVSRIMAAAESLAHYKHACERDPDEQTAAMQLGSLLHTLVLEPEKYNERYYGPEDQDGLVLLRTKSDYTDALIEELGQVSEERVDADRYKDLMPEKSDKKEDLEAKWNEVSMIFEKNDLHSKFVTPEHFNEKMSGKKKVDMTMLDKATVMSAAIRNHPIWRLHVDLKDAVIEQEIAGEIDGVRVTGHPDLWIWSDKLNAILIVDVKTTRNIEPRAFERLACQSNYPVQAWCYSELVRQNTGKNCYFMYAGVANSAPHIAEMYLADQAHMEYGEKVARRALNRIKLYEQARGIKSRMPWLGYTEGKLVSVAIPHYAMQDFDWGSDS